MNKIKFIALLAIVWFSACKNPVGQSKKGIDLKAFLKDTTTNVQNGGVQVVPLTRQKENSTYGQKRLETILKSKCCCLMAGRELRMNISNVWQVFYLPKVLSLSITTS
ncbi:hypothetical protein HDF19_18635 [Mucilaginibacter sp. E4BP6]|uniref:hypothetical protein n=1 Tax=Mucilaginibacter sp. E4BP6 TaxID=2723089 RepID=UPI001835505E|nr:hypothetical protein [Mucilaginibacter sp. E4BP6]NYE66087.1 hypothetical protein [Mucilaginibacter sp. E4BP6]